VWNNILYDESWIMWELILRYSKTESDDAQIADFYQNQKSGKIVYSSVVKLSIIILFCIQQM